MLRILLTLFVFSKSIHGGRLQISPQDTETANLSKSLGSHQVYFDLINPWETVDYDLSYKFCNRYGRGPLRTIPKRDTSPTPVIFQRTITTNKITLRTAVNISPERTKTRVIETQPPVITGTFTFEYPDVYVAIQTISQNPRLDDTVRNTPTVIPIAPTHVFNHQTFRPRKIRRNINSFKLKDPALIFTKYGKAPQNVSDWSQQWENSVSYLGGGCISPAQFRFKDGDFKYVGGPRMNRLGFTGMHGEFTGSSLDIDAVVNMSRPSHFDKRLPPVFYAPFCKNLQLLPDRIYPEEGFTIPVCNCRGRIQLYDDIPANGQAKNSSNNLRCAASMFRWQYDVVEKEKVFKILMKAIPGFHASEFVADDVLAKVPRRLVLAGEQSLLELTPAQQVLIDQNTDPDPINDPALSNATSADSQIWIPRIFSSEAGGGARFSSRFKNIVTMAAEAADASSIPNAAFILGDEFSGRNTIYLDGISIAFRGTEVTAGGHTFQIPVRTKLVMDGSVTYSMTPIIRSNLGVGQPMTSPAIPTDVGDLSGTVDPIVVSTESKGTAPSGALIPSMISQAARKTVSALGIIETPPVITPTTNLVTTPVTTSVVTGSSDSLRLEETIISSGVTRTPVPKPTQPSIQQSEALKIQAVDWNIFFFGLSAIALITRRASFI